MLKKKYMEKKRKRKKIKFKRLNVSHKFGSTELELKNKYSKKYLKNSLKN